MARAYGEVFVADTRGNVVAAAAVDLLDPLTDVRISATVYADATSSTEITLPTVTDATGKLPFYLATGQIVKARATINGVTFDDIIAAGDPTASGSGGGGATLQTQTATVTTDADTFCVAHVFDLEAPSVAYIKATVLALTADGETWGDAPGEIAADMVLDQTSSPSIGGVSRDAVFYVNAAVGFTLHQAPITAVSGVIDVVELTPRYVSVVIFLYDGGGLIYAGANHPTAQVRIDVEYLSATGDGGGGGDDADDVLDITVSNSNFNDLGAISKGTVVCWYDIVNADGIPQVYIAADPRPQRGVPLGIMLADLSLDGTASCRIHGAVDGLDTSGFSVSDDIYLDASGGFTGTPETGAWVGLVLTSDASNGSVYIGSAIRTLGSISRHGHTAGEQNGEALYSPEFGELGTGSIATPASGVQALFIDNTTHHLSRKDSSDVVTDIETAAFVGSSVLIDSQTLLVDTTTVTFSSIPAIYSCLLLIWTARGTDATTSAHLRCQFNGDTGNNYDYFYTEYVPSVGYSVVSLLATAGGRFGRMAAATAASGDAGSGELWVPHYAGTTFNKLANARDSSLSGTGAAAQFGGSRSFNWRSTAAISSLALTDETGGDFLTGSRFDLYGMG